MKQIQSAEYTFPEAQFQQEHSLSHGLPRLWTRSPKFASTFNLSSIVWGITRLSFNYAPTSTSCFPVLSATDLAARAYKSSSAGIVDNYRGTV